MFKFFKKPVSPVFAEPQPEIAPDETPRERFEREKMSRRAMLRSMGVMTGAAVMTLVSSDDLARLAVSKLRENEATREIGDTLAKEFRSAGVAFAATPPVTADWSDIHVSCSTVTPGTKSSNDHGCEDCSVALAASGNTANIAALAAGAGVRGITTTLSSREDACAAEAAKACNDNNNSGISAFTAYNTCLLTGLVSDAILGELQEDLIRIYVAL